MWVTLVTVVALGIGGEQVGVFGAEADKADESARWPRKFEHEGVVLLAYQPQVDSWDHGKIECRTAVAVTAKGAKTPAYGVVSLSGKTRTNLDKRVVTIYDIARSRSPSGAK